MERLTAKNLRLIRNIIMFTGIIVSFILWIYIPSFIENNRLVHVGNGKYGSKLGFLLIVLLPLLGLIPRKPGEEIHTTDTQERAKIKDEWEIKSEKTQIAYTLGGAIAACFIMILIIVFG